MVMTTLLAVLVLNTVIFNGIILYKDFIEPQRLMQAVHPVEEEGEKLKKETDGIVDEFSEFMHNTGEDKAMKAEAAFLKGI